MMKDDELREFLLREVYERTNFKVPFPPKDSRDRVQYLSNLGALVCPEYVFNCPVMDWFESPEIQNFYKAYPEEQKRYNMDRRWNVLQLLRLIKAVPGDTAECGVYEGATSLLILEHAPVGPDGHRTHHIFDSFAGLSAPGGNDHPYHFQPGDLACSEDAVRDKLAGYEERTRYYKGWIPERFPEVGDKIFAFVHLDVDLYEPTKDGIEFFYPLLSPGAILVCDDYGCNTCPGATKAIDDYLADKTEKMISLSSGGGFLIRGTPTS